MNTSTLDADAKVPIEMSSSTSIKSDLVVLIQMLSESISNLMLSTKAWVSTSSGSKGVFTFHLVSSENYLASSGKEGRTAAL